MTTPTTADLMKYADLQMAAEAFLVDEEGALVDLKTALVRGNDHASKFTTTQADNFVAHWEVVDQKANTTTGFSGTLFRNRDTGELVVSMRSTEFLDDALRDGQATNTLEIKEKGWAFGQIADMEKWYSDIKTLYAGKFSAAGNKFAVTGYSLGGHLATAFNLLRKDDADLHGVVNPITATYTFNGAGVGKVNAGRLTDVITAFARQRANTSGTEFTFGSPLIDGVYGQLRGIFNGNHQNNELGSLLTQAVNAINTLGYGSVVKTSGNGVGLNVNEGTLNPALAKLPQLLSAINPALRRIGSIMEEGVRIAGITDSNGNPVQIPGTKVDATKLDYQMAVLSAARNTTPGPTLLNGDLPTAVSRPTNPWTFSNFYDVYGATSLSAVSNSQYHYGMATPVAIEDQPDVRGNILGGVAARLAIYQDIKLLGPNFSSNDFGDTHSLVLMVDSLNVQNTLAQLDPSLSVGALTSIFKASSYLKSQSVLLGQGNVLENLVNSLGKILGVDTLSGWTKLKGNSDGNTWWQTDVVGGYTGRNALYKNLELLTASDAFKAMVGKAAIAIGGSSLASTAKTDFALFLSLNALSPVVISTTDTVAVSALKSSNAALATSWTADKNARLSGDTTKAFDYSDNWYADRAALLQAIVLRHQKDSASDSLATDSAPADRNLQFQWYGADPLLGEIRPRLSTLTLTKPYYADRPVQRIAFGDEGANAMIGIDSTLDDRLYGGAGDDTFDGKGGNDYLEGGSGLDTYQFSNSFGKDTIVDSDGKGKLTFGGADLTGGKFEGAASAWVQKINGDTILYKLVGSSASSTGKQLVISKQGDNTNSITINHFDATKATDTTPGNTGYLGIKLDSTRKLAITEGNPGTNFWSDSAATLASLVGKASTFVEGTARAFTIALNMGAKAGDTITLAMGGAGDKFKAILGDSTVPAHGAVITLTEGQTELRISLVETEALTADASATLSATYKSGDPVANPPVLSNVWGITVKDSGEASRTFNGNVGAKPPIHGMPAGRFACYRLARRQQGRHTPCQTMPMGRTPRLRRSILLSKTQSLSIA